METSELASLFSISGMSCRWLCWLVSCVCFVSVHWFLGAITQGERDDVVGAYLLH